MLKRWIPEFTWVALGKLSSLLGSVILVKFLTHSLDLIEYAQITLGLTICNFFTQVIMGALGQGIGRVYVDAASRSDFSGFKKSLFNINKSVILLYIYLIAAALLAGLLFGLQQWMPFALILIVYSYVYGLNDISAGLQNLARNRKQSVLAGLIEIVIKLVLIYGLVRIFDLGVLSVVIIYLLASLIALMYQVRVFEMLETLPATAANDKKVSDWRQQIFLISTPAAFAGIFVWLQQASDKWALNYFHGSESVAQYTVVYQLGYAPFLIGMGVVMSLLTPVIYKTQKRSIMKKLLIFVLGITALGIVFSVAYFEKLFAFIVDIRYVAASKYLPFMLVSAGLFQAGEIVSSQMMGENRSKDIFKVKMLAACVCVMSNTLGAYLYGIPGVVGSMIVFGLTYFVLFMAFLVSKNSTGVCDGK